MGRALAAVLAGAFACTSVPKRPLPPAPEWAVNPGAGGHSNRAVQVSGPVNVAKASGDLSEDDAHAGLEVALAREFVDAGILLGAAGPFGPGLQLWTLSGSSINGALTFDEKRVDTFTVDIAATGCYSASWDSARAREQNYACFAREILRTVFESQKLAAAAQPSSAAPGQPRPALTGKLAVLDLRNFAKELSRENAQYFTDLVRGAALRTQPQLEVITRENLLVLLQSTGRSLADCEGDCEVETGRRIGADEIISGELQKLGNLYKLSLRLHDTREGRLLGSAIASGKSVEELDGAAQKAAEDLLSGR